MTRESGYQLAQLVSLGEACDAMLASRVRVLQLFGEDDPEASLRARAPDIVAVVTSVRQGLAQSTIQALPQLKAICSWGMGYETLALEAAHARGIMASNTPDVLSDCVADLAWGLILACARRLVVGDRYVRAGEWRAPGKFPLSTRVSGKRLGILGLGRIGAAIARRGVGFGMEVRYHNRNVRHEFPEYGYEPSLHALAGWADFLVLACPGGPATHHQVDASVLRALGPNGIVVNIARGSVIDESALVALLDSGELGGAGLDVFEHEPHVPEELKQLDQVVLMPHVGSATEETRRDMARLVVDNVMSFMETGELLTPIAGMDGKSDG